MKGGMRGLTKEIILLLKDRPEGMTARQMAAALPGRRYVSKRLFELKKRGVLGEDSAGVYTVADLSPYDGRIVKILDAVKAVPGSDAGEIARRVGTRVYNVYVPLRELVSTGRIKRVAVNPYSMKADYIYFPAEAFP